MMPTNNLNSKVAQVLAKLIHEAKRTRNEALKSGERLTLRRGGRAAAFNVLQSSLALAHFERLLEVAEDGYAELTERAIRRHHRILTDGIDHELWDACSAAQWAVAQVLDTILTVYFND